MRFFALWVLAAAALRLALALLVPEEVLERVELVTPFTSLAALREARFLRAPYASSLVHHPPLLLAALPPALAPALNVACDLAGAACVFLMARAFSRSPEAALDQPSSRVSPHSAALIFLFNPLSVLACAAPSTQPLYGALVLACLCAAFWKQRGLASACLALAVYLQPHSVALLPALVALCGWLVAPAFACALALAVLASTALQGGSWAWVDSCYVALVTVRDLRPNIGMFWYFFTEVFEHFRPFYLAIFQLLYVAYPIPIAIKLRHRPALMCWSLLVTLALWKPYPSVGDVSLHLALLPLLHGLLSRSRYAFLVANAYLYVFVLGALFWRMWVLSGTGNANFFYAMTLVLTMATTLLLSETVNGALENDFRRRNKLKLR